MTLHSDRQQLYELTEDDVSDQFEGTTRDQAWQYYTDDCVFETEIDGAALYGVIDDDTESHVAEISVQDGSIYLGCTCDHQGSGICAHVGAVLMAWVHERETFEGYDPAYEPKHVASFPQVADLADEYREILVHQTINELRALAKRRGIEIKGTRKEPIIDELASQLCDRASIRGQIVGLDELGQEMLIYLHLILGPGYGLTSENIISGLSKKHANLPRGTLYDQTVDLAQQGLLLLFKRDSRVYYMLPQAVRTCLPPRPGFVPFYPEEKLDQLEIRERTATSTIRSLYAVWDYISKRHPKRHPAPRRLQIEDQWPQLTGWNHLSEEIKEIARRRQNPYNLYNVSMTIPEPTWHLSNAHRNAIRKQTGHTDEENELYYVILETLGAIDGEPGELVTHHSEAFERILSLPPSIQMYIIIYAWLSCTGWSEIDILQRSAQDIRLRRNLMYSSFKPDELYEEWRAGRQIVLRFLSTIPEGQWVSVDGLLRTIFEVSPDLIHSHSDAGVWWIESRKTRKQFGTTFEDWQDSSGRFIITVLEGPLAWFGAVSLGYQDDKLVAFKVTPVGSFVLQRREAIVEAETQATPKDAVQFSDDLTVVLIPGHAPAQLYDLLHFIGTLEEATPERFEYQITATGVLLALERGQTIKSLLAQIGKWSGTEVPATWQEKMNEWSQNYGKLHIYDDITLIEMADVYALQELMSNTSIRDHLIYQFSPQLVAIRPDAVDTLVQEMEKRGYTPHVE